MSNYTYKLSVHKKNEVVFKITIEHVIDQMVILKATSNFYNI
jgi:hypothetical protein